ncbi:alpha/beta hydrolase [Asticcacaulis sp. 201]|uniref:alpha/beta hydrolase n=1 Tax=Asticcacaulis sp. 201 TaxID=3028787 RepID=UPI00291713BE|nr:alpha/beta hydrolase [Asticcacaulis sp. 201]MDV6330148.1 alpha/beta hydrolase [Asticcacaulis sp. 201]
MRLPAFDTRFLNTWLLKRALSLPAAVLRFVSGGGVVHVAGRTLDPQIQCLWRALYSQASGRTGLSLTAKSLETARQEWQEAAALFGLPSDIRVRFESIGGEGAAAGTIPRGLLIRPARVSEDAPLLVFFHQGGGVLGGPDLSRAFAVRLAHQARCPVFLPEYRLAPVYRFPAALDDARAAFDWAQANAARLGAPSGRVAIGGILTGAGLALRVSLDLRRDFKPSPVAQLLVTPLADLSDTHSPANAALGLWPLSSADIDLLIGHYAGGGASLTDPRLSPALEPLLVGQPRTFVVSAGLDPLADQAETLVQRLIAARVPTVYRRYDTLPLGFDLFAAVVDAAAEATDDIADTWVELLRSGQGEPEAEPEAETDSATAVA